MKTTSTTRPTKTQRLHILVEPKFKRFLHAEAQRANLSVAELVRQRFEHQPSQEEALLAALTAELNRRVAEVSAAADRTIALADQVVAELRAGRANREKAASELASARASRRHRGVVDAPA